jgi:hypothetical protein
MHVLATLHVNGATHAGSHPLERPPPAPFPPAPPAPPVLAEEDADTEDTVPVLVG